MPGKAGDVGHTAVLQSLADEVSNSERHSEPFQLLFIFCCKIAN